MDDLHLRMEAKLHHLSRCVTPPRSQRLAVCVTLGCQGEAVLCAACALALHLPAHMWTLMRKEDGVSNTPP